MKYPLALLLGIILTTSLCARESFGSYDLDKEPTVPNQPWLTGPLLSPSGHVIPEGHQNYEPYIYWTQATGRYDSHWKSQSRPTFNNVLTQGTIQLGVLPYTEFDVAPQFVYNETKGQHMWRVSDLPLTLAFQLLLHHPSKWYPNIKLRFGANVPLGKYDHLSPSRLGTDAGGIGGWFPGAGIVFSRLFHITGKQFLAWRLFLDYAFGTPVNVHGLSVHGGAASTAGLKGTRGTVYLGNIFQTIIGLEYSLTQNWVLALDIQYQHNNKHRFSGSSPPGTKPTAPSKELFALAPAIEYNFSSNVGIIAGPWFSVAGRNTQDFISYVIAINIYN